ncbi:MAG: hypothetical protein LBM04_03990 [Opitutaceae bacterium]|nr:hypothetical protein [Opitutaceae bacterium]
MFVTFCVICAGAEKISKNGKLSKAWQITGLFSIILFIASTMIFIIRVADYFQRERAEMDAQIAAAEAGRAAVKQAAAAKRLAGIPALAERYLHCLDTNPDFPAGADPASRKLNEINMPIREKLSRRDYAAITEEEYNVMRRVVYALETAGKLSDLRALAAEYHGNDPIICKKIRDAEFFGLSDDEIKMMKDWISAHKPASDTGQRP